MRVLKQLVEALLFERIVEWSSHDILGADPRIEFGVGRTRYVCTGHVGPFGRVRISPRSVCRAEDGDRRGVHWLELVEALPLDARRRSEVAEDLANTERFCRWNVEHLDANATRRDQSYEALESSLHEGHPYHPCFKARSGFSMEDHRLYGPEAGRRFALRWVAVERTRLRGFIPSDEDSFGRSTLGEETWLEVDGARARASLERSRYGVLPVHPWQWRYLEANHELAAAMARREIVPLHTAVGAYRATQSLRTLLPANDPALPSVKLPLAVRVSSSERLMQPELVSAGPALSSWLKELVDTDPFSAEVAETIVLREFAGVSYSPVETGTALDGHLAAIWRDSIAQYLRPGERAVPFNAIAVCENDERPFIAPWLDRYGLLRWSRRLLEVAVLPVWRLLVHHGVAVEAHAQNMILVHRDGWPERVALRDFHESVEFVQGFLREPERAPNFAALHPRFECAPADRYYAMSSVEELREVFMDTVFVFNLTEVAHLLQRHYGFAEERFWALVRELLTNYSESWGDADRERELGHRAALVRTESLFRGRLQEPEVGGHHHWISNALRGPSERTRHA